jgi:NAD(P) transhydrogenase subunit alpha
MTGALALLPLFLAACAGGYIAARPRTDSDRPAWRSGIGGVAAILLVGTLIAAAEAGSAMARYIALIALLCASAASVLLLGVPERGLTPDSDGDDGVDG